MTFEITPLKNMKTTNLREKATFSPTTHEKRKKKERWIYDRTTLCPCLLFAFFCVCAFFKTMTAKIRLYKLMRILPGGVIGNMSCRPRRCVQLNKAKNCVRSRQQRLTVNRQRI